MMQDEEAQLENWFTYHPPRDAEQLQNYVTIRSVGKELAQTILRSTPPGSERDKAIDKVREAVMWANAGIACSPPE